MVGRIVDARGNMTDSFARFLDQLTREADAAATQTVEKGGGLPFASYARPVNATVRAADYGVDPRAVRSASYFMETKRARVASYGAASPAKRFARYS